MKKKILKIALIIFVVLFLSFLLFLPSCFIVHSILTGKEKTMLEEYGYIGTYSAGQYNLNIQKLGNQNSAHKLIALSGLNVDNFSVEMTHVNDELIKDYQLIYIDRAGYGYSDDTDVKQSVEQVVSDYRTALKNAGIEPPYILMPHSLGGLYATYWQNLYPDEIEGVIFIDSSELGNDVWEEEDYKISTWDYIELAGCKLGLHRLNLRKYVYPVPDGYSEKDQKVTDALYARSLLGKAKLSEMQEMNTNTNLTFSSIKANTIPKIYICCHTGFRDPDDLTEYITWVQNRQKQVHIKVWDSLTKEEKENAIGSFIKWEKEHTLPYLNKMGNTEIVYLPGDHMIFEQKPKELANIIDDFVKKLK